MDYTDVIEVYKIRSDTEKMDRDQQFIVSSSKRIIGHHMKPARIKFKTNKSKWLFFEWILYNWNSVPKSVLSARNVHRFKERLKKNLKERSAEKLVKRQIALGS